MKIRATANGLKIRPLAETAVATLDWLRHSVGENVNKDFGNPNAEAGLTPTHERQLLDAWNRL